MKYIVVATLALFAISCSDSDSNSSSSVSGTIFGAASSAIAAAGQALPGSSTLADGEIRPLDSDCDGMITDPATDASGAGEFLGCILTTNSMSPGTPLGSFHLTTEIMSMLESNISFTYGADFTEHENIQGTVSTSDGNQVVNLSLRERAVTGVWDYHVQLCIHTIDGDNFGGSLPATLADCNSGSFVFELYLVDSNNKLGFKLIDRIFGVTSGTAFLIDSTSEELRYESWDASNGRHTRVYVLGAVSTSYVLDNVTAVNMAMADQGMVQSGNGTDALYASFDGTNLCINAWDDDDNDHSNGVGTGGTHDLTAQGTCSSFPVYDGAFFTPSSLETFLSDETKGILNFTGASFSIDSYFIDI